MRVSDDKFKITEVLTLTITHFVRDSLKLLLHYPFPIWRQWRHFFKGIIVFIYKQKSCTKYDFICCK